MYPSEATVPRSWGWFYGLVLASVVGGCAPMGAGPGAPADQARAHQGRTLTLIARGEPPT